MHCMPYGERLEEEGAVDLLALVAPHPEVHLHEPAEDPDDDGDHKENREDALRLIHLHRRSILFHILLGTVPILPLPIILIEEHRKVNTT